MSDNKPIIQTQFAHETRWVPTSKKDVLRIILDEMPETDAEATLAYLIGETKKGKTVTLGGCRFKAL